MADDQEAKHSLPARPPASLHDTTRVVADRTRRRVPRPGEGPTAASDPGRCHDHAPTRRQSAPRRGPRSPRNSGTRARAPEGHHHDHGQRRRRAAMAELQCRPAPYPGVRPARRQLGRHQPVTRPRERRGFGRGQRHLADPQSQRRVHRAHGERQRRPFRGCCRQLLERRLPRTASIRVAGCRGKPRRHPRRQRDPTRAFGDEPGTDRGQRGLRADGSRRRGLAERARQSGAGTARSRARGELRGKPGSKPGSKPVGSSACREQRRNRRWPSADSPGGRRCAGSRDPKHRSTARRGDPSRRRPDRSRSDSRRARRPQPGSGGSGRRHPADGRAGRNSTGLDRRVRDGGRRHRARGRRTSRPRRAAHGGRGLRRLRFDDPRGRPRVRRRWGNHRLERSAVPGIRSTLGAWRRAAGRWRLRRDLQSASTGGDARAGRGSFARRSR